MHRTATLDTTLTPPGTHYGATQSKAQRGSYRRRRIAANRLASHRENTRKEMHPSRIYVIERITLRREGGVSDADRSSRKGEFHAAITDERHGLRRRRLRADQRSAQ